LAGLSGEEPQPSAAPAESFEAAAPDSDDSRKLSKAAKARAKKAAAEADRERSIAEAKLTCRDYASEETLAISDKLKLRGLRVVQVPSDGNCLYRSLLHQWASRVAVSSYQEVRTVVASEMQLRPALYASFVELDGDEDYDGWQPPPPPLPSSPPPPTLFPMCSFAPAIS
jgi:hypothetical protein